SWVSINDNLAQSHYGADAYWVNDIVINPVNHESVYIATSVGLFRSLTGGGNWELLYPTIIEDEEDPRVVGTVAIDPADDQVIYTGLGNSAVGSWADFEPFANDLDFSGVFKSTNGGVSWTECPVGFPPGTAVHSIVIHPNSPSHVILASTNGIFRSTNAGDTWMATNANLPHTNAYQMIGVLDGSTFHLYLSLKTLGTIGDSTSFSGGLYHSSDFGENWTDITGNLPTYDPYEGVFYDYWKFDVNPLDPAIILTGPTRGSGFEAPGIYKTTNGGSTWTMVHTAFTSGWLDPDWFWERYIYGIKFAPTDTSRITTCLDQVDQSNDGGMTWSQKYTYAQNGAWHGAGLELMNTEVVAFDADDPDIMYVGYDDMGLFRSDDGGYSYYRLDSHQDPTIGNLTDIDAVKDIQIDPVNGEAYISRYQGSQGGLNQDFSSGGIVFSNDHGNTQTDITGSLPRGRSDLVLDGQSGSPGNRTLYTAIYHHGVYKSANSGGSWDPINTGLGTNAAYAWEIAIDPNDSQTLYLGLNSMGAEIPGLYKSSDGGAGWNLLTSFPAGDVLTVYIDDSSTVYAAISDNFDWNYTGGLYRSNDDGVSWELILPHSRVIDVQRHPTDEDILLVAGQPWYRAGGDGGRLYFSTDNGTTWNIISSGMGHTFFNFARFNPHNPDQILAGTAGGGLWRGSLQPTHTVHSETAVPARIILEQNYPNPFNPTTTISYHLLEPGYVTLAIYRLDGTLIRSLITGWQDKGSFSVRWNGTDNTGKKVSSAVYLYRLETPNHQQVRKLILLK
ncbi:MAG: T9SS type A sorting domain-containing protein, partial [Lentisphaeria bacterium]|nr:T9SS type A sorting domain-containing protein [Lentisphaeria bacterium]